MDPRRLSAKRLQRRRRLPRPPLGALACSDGGHAAAHVPANHPQRAIHAALFLALPLPATLPFPFLGGLAL